MHEFAFILGDSAFGANEMVIRGLSVGIGDGAQDHPRVCSGVVSCSYEQGVTGSGGDEEPSREERRVSWRWEAC